MRLRAIHIAPLVSGLLLVLSFPPFQLVLPSFIALVPLLAFLERERSTVRAVLGAFLCGLVFWGALLYWITIFTDAGFVVLILIMASNLALFAWVTRRLESRFGLPLAVSAPFVWTAIDYIHAHGDLAFTWGQPAYSLTYYPALIQFAEFCGPYGVTFWLVAFNGLLYTLYKRYRSSLPVGRTASAAALMIVLPLAWGSLVLNNAGDDLAGGDNLRVSYIQPSIAQELKWSAEMRDSTFEILGQLSVSQAAERPDLVVWPEAAAPAYLRTDRRWREYVGSVAQGLDCYLLTGAPEYHFHEDRKDYDSYNSAFLFAPNGLIAGKYDKIHMVPVSERMPFEDIFTGLKKIDVGGSHFVPGDSLVVFHTGLGDFGTLICFESIFPEISRGMVRGGAQFLVNMTNDAWFERTSAAYQHSAFLVLRAIENRRAIVRSANTGVSAFYDSYGRRRQATKLYERTAATSGIRLRSDRTLYNRLGDWPAHLCWVLSLAALFVSFFRNRKPAA